MDDRRGDDRGQLILIAGVGIAVALVALALVLNSLVFTQYLATKPTADGGDAIAYEHAVEDGVRGLVSAANVRDYGAEAPVTVRKGTHSLSDLLTQQYGAYGTLVNATVHVTPGTSVHQAQNRSFTNKAHEGNWPLFSNALDVRGFRMNVSTVDADSVSRAFALNVALESGIVQPVAIYANASGDGIVVNDTLVGKTCRAGEPTTIDFANGTVGGDDCPALDFLNGANITRVTVENGSRASGRYVVVVKRADGTAVTSTSNYYETPNRSPYAVSAVYAATVNAAYVSPDVTYRTDIHIEPKAFGTVTASYHADDEPDGGGTDDIRYGVIPKTGGLVFTDSTASTNLSVVSATGRITRLPPTTATVIGPQEYDFTGDGYLDVPYTDGSGTIYLANESGSMRLPVSNAEDSSSLLAVGSWNGSAPSIFYAGGDKVHRINPGTGVAHTLFSDYDTDSISAIAGVGDIDADGEPEFVYLDGSSTISYRETNPADQETNGEVQGIGGYGVGAPADFANDSTAAVVPYVDSSGYVSYVNANIDSQKLLTDMKAAKVPLTTYDVDGDEELEIVFVRYSDNQLWYVDNVVDAPTPKQFENATGGAIVVDKDTGVA
ncbi:hypothetical protein J2752_002398 [Halarchaeum rubridurum]|uniref:Uncharacterized protein n=1 Tax=Halarchaeum rubridurum TaxID=489911 RepID=A0A830G2K6_9EURY|nr:hypothetical protein [Halarchaeum rubridurum]MBP1955475.1 hypothetical protein [Halarchaeum rubridurum]GGM72632.1 hypothetical protein GCM10009017_23280 [Halarchaeum rubridurum]